MQHTNNWRDATAPTTFLPIQPEGAVAIREEINAHDSPLVTRNVFNGVVKGHALARGGIEFVPTLSIQRTCISCQVA